MHKDAAILVPGTCWLCKLIHVPLGHASSFRSDPTRSHALPAEDLQSAVVSPQPIFRNFLAIYVFLLLLCTEICLFSLYLLIGHAAVTKSVVNPFPRLLFFFFSLVSPLLSPPFVRFLRKVKSFPPETFFIISGFRKQLAVWLPMRQ